MNKARTIESFVCIAVLLTVLFVGVWQIKPAHATALFSNGYEDDYSSWTGTTTSNGGTIAINTTVVHAGSKSSRSFGNGTGSQVSEAYATKTLSSSYTELYVRIWLNMTSHSGSDYIRAFVGASGSGGYTYLGIGVTSSNAIRVSFWNQTTTTVTSATTVSLSTGTFLEGRVLIGTGTGLIRVWKDGVNVTDLAVSDLQNNYGGSATIDTIRVGIVNTYDNVVVFTDDVVVDSSYVGVGDITYSDISASPTVAGENAVFRTKFTTATYNLSFYIFSWDNGSVTMANDTTTAFPTDLKTYFLNITKTINATVATHHWQIFVNNTNNDWVETPLQSFTSTAAPVDYNYYNFNFTDLDNQVVNLGSSSTYYPSEYSRLYTSEIRGVFVHAASSASGCNLTLIAETLASLNVNTMFIEAGGINYPRWGSTIISGATDWIGSALTVGHANGLKVYVTFNTLSGSVNNGVYDTRATDTTLAKYSGSSDPSVQSTLSLLHAEMNELFTKYPAIDGFVFDYIRLADGIDTSYSQDAKAAFIAYTGYIDTNFPTDVLSGGKYRQQWKDWQNYAITDVISQMRGWILALDPTCEIGALPWNYGGLTPTYWRYWLAQDAAYWIRQGLVDFICPMFYTDSLSSVSTSVNNLRAWTLGTTQGAVPIVPFIDDNEGGFSTPENFSSRVALLRQLGVKGWVLFRYGGPGDATGDTPAQVPDCRDYLNSTMIPTHSAFDITDIISVATTSSATVTWTTTSATMSTVEYSTSPLFTYAKTVYGDFWYYQVTYAAGSLQTDETNVTSHLASLGSLTSNVLYYFRVQSQDQNHTDTSKVYTFSTNIGMSWELYNGTTLLLYTQGQSSLLSGTYTLKTYHHGFLINSTSLDTAVIYNATVQLKLMMKPHTSVSQGYLVFNDTITSLTINEQTSAELNFTASGSSPQQIIVDVPNNATFIYKDSVPVTSDWTYYASSTLPYIVINASSLSTWTLLFEEGVPVLITITYPTNTTCSSPTVPVELYATGGTIDTILWNCKNGSSWIYGSNITYTAPTSMTGFVNGTAYTFYAWANNTDGNWDEETVMFTVLIIVVPYDWGSWWGDWW